MDTFNQLLISRIIRILVAIVIPSLLLSCFTKSDSDGENLAPLASSVSDSTQNSQNSSYGQPNTETKFLITNKSVGYFKLGESWKNFAQQDYNYSSSQAYGICIDACCDGGYELMKNTLNKDNESTFENSEMLIGAMLFDNSESDREHSDNENVFYSSSDNCNGWYWKDKIKYIVVYSQEFKTKEGVGVGTNLQKAQEVLGNLTINIGWLEEDENAVNFKVDSYPDILFILDAEDAGGYEKLSMLEERKLKVSDFNAQSVIKKLIVGTQNEI